MKELKKIIQKANPKIMELELGCKVKFDNIFGYIVGVNSTQIKIYWRGANNNLYNWYNKKSFSKKEIIGRPITLADCTNAIIKSKRWRGLELKKQVKDFFNLNMYWDCENDNLDNQLEQTISFLKKILIK